MEVLGIVLVMMSTTLTYSNIPGGNTTVAALGVFTLASGLVVRYLDNR